jgi:hypothetical protein
MKSRGSGTTSTLRPSLSSKLPFRLIDLTISFAIKHLAILSKLIHWIVISIANDAAARNSGDVVPSSPTTTSLRVASWSSDTFSIISVFQLLHFDVLYSMHVWHAPSSGHSQPNELDGTSRGSSTHSNHPNDGDIVAWFLVLTMWCLSVAML